MAIDESDPDIEEYLAAQKKARRESILNLIRVVIAGGVAAAVGIGVLYLIMPKHGDTTSHVTFRGRRGRGGVLVLGACVAAGTVGFLLTFRLLGGKLDGTWSFLKDRFSSRDDGF